MIEKQFNIAIDPDLETTSDGANSGGAPFSASQALGTSALLVPWLPAHLALDEDEMVAAELVKFHISVGCISTGKR